VHLWQLFKYKFVSILQLEKLPGMFFLIQHFFDWQDTINLG